MCDTQIKDLISFAALTSDNGRDASNASRPLSPGVFVPALSLLSIPIVAFVGMLDGYIFDMYGIENLQ